MKYFTSRAFAALCIAVIITASQLTATVQALGTYDKTYFKQNDITYYDSRCKNNNNTELMQLAGKDTTEKILNFFMRKGLQLWQATGIVGNMVQESGLNPAIIQGGKIADDSYVLQDGVGFGLVQWTSGGRQKNFMAFMKEMGVGVTNLNGQLEFVWKEMSESYPKTMDALKKADNPVDAAIAVHGPPSPGYEASADSPEKVRTVRGGYAQKVFDQYNDAPALAGSTADMAMAPSGAEEGASKAAAPATKNGIKSTICNKADEASDDIGKLKKLLLDYAWPDFVAGKTEQKPAYADAVKKARDENRYVGGAGGNDCGGFITTIMVDSGYEPNYNSGRGNTITQEAWLKQNWEYIGANTERKPGDVAINENHTYMYVGEVEGFNSKIASASLGDRSPMAGSEGEHDPSFNWYRKKVGN